MTTLPREPFAPSEEPEDERWTVQRGTRAVPLFALAPQELVDLQRALSTGGFSVGLGVLLNEGMRFVPFLPDALIGQARLAILGMLIVALMLFRPQGLVGKFKL